MAIGGFVLFLAVAGAQPAEPAFTITTPSGTFEVLRRASPPPRDLSGGDLSGSSPGEDRTCRVGLTLRAGRVETHDRGCPRQVVGEVTAAVSHWSIQGPQTSAPVDLGEVWFVYPDAFGAPRVLMRQAHDRQLSLPADVDAVPYTIRVWSFLRWPEAIYREDHPDVRCEVEIEANARGITTLVLVTGCEEPFRGAVEQAIGQWRFEPAMVDGVPIPTALSLTTTFVAESPPEPERPSARSQQLWADRQFGLLTREERMWFIRATLLAEERDLGPGRVLVSLPPPPLLGNREAPVWVEEVVHSVPELPDHDPILVVGGEDKPGIEVFTMDLPERAEGSTPGRCPLVVQVDDTRQVISWAEPSCPQALRSLALETADAWILRLLESEGAQSRARFRVRLEVADDGTMSAVLPADELRSTAGALPPRIHTEREATVTTRVPPRLSRNLTLEEGLCELAVTVDERGHPDQVNLLEDARCPVEVRRAAVAAVKRWRWRPAEWDGQARVSQTRVSIRFQP